MEKEELNDEQGLLRSIAQADMQAYQQLFALYWDRVYGMGLRLTKSPEQARDLAQDVFVKLWDNREKLPGVKNLSAYLFTLTRNLIHDQIRSRVFRESNREFLTNYFDYKDSSPQDLLEQKELGEALDNAIQKLPPKLREVFNLHRLEGLNHEEIAKRLNITYLSSKTYMVRALMALRKEIIRNSSRLLFLTGLFFNCL